MLNSVSLKLLKLTDLKNLCKNAKLKITKLNKLQLFDIYNHYLATKLIQKVYRNHFYRNSECSITLEKVRYPCFVFRTKFGKLFFYDYQSITKYICKTGNTHDPMTREQYSDEDLQRLDLSLKKYYPETKYSSTLKIKRNLGYARKVRDRENNIITYQTLLEETKLLILNLIDSGIFISGISEQISVGNENFLSTDDYLIHLLEKVNVIYNTLKEIDNFWAMAFKIDFLENLEHHDTKITQIKNIIEFINAI